MSGFDEAGRTVWTGCVGAALGAAAPAIAELACVSLEPHAAAASTSAASATILPFFVDRFIRMCLVSGLFHQRQPRPHGALARLRPLRQPREEPQQPGQALQPRALLQAGAYLERAPAVAKEPVHAFRWSE